MSKYSFRVVQRYHVYVMDNFGNDFVATVGGAPLAVIKQYIENQKCN